MQAFGDKDSDSYTQVLEPLDEPFAMQDFLEGSADFCMNDVVGTNGFTSEIGTLASTSGGGGTASGSADDDGSGGGGGGGDDDEGLAEYRSRVASTSEYS